MYSRISHSQNGKAAIEYAMGRGKGHNNNRHRNIRISTVNMADPSGNYVQQMNRLWRKARKNHRTQVRRIILSFSDKELSGDSEEDLEIAEQIGGEMVKKLYPDRQAILFLQNDGIGGKLHLHVIINDVSLTNHKGCSKQQCHFMYLQRGVNEIARKYIELDHGKTGRNRRTQTERVKGQAAQELLIKNNDLGYTEIKEILIKRNKYSYKDDMKTLILMARNSSRNETEFREYLNSTGVIVTKKESKRNGIYYVFDYVQCPVKVKNTRSRSTKLGDEFSPVAMEIYWNANNKNLPDTGIEPTFIKNKDELLDNHDISYNKEYIEQSGDKVRTLRTDRQKIQESINITANMIQKIRSEQTQLEKTNKRIQQLEYGFNISESRDLDRSL